MPSTREQDRKVMGSGRPTLQLPAYTTTIHDKF